MARESRDVWAKRVERLRESDLTAEEFAREIGVNVQTLRHWKWKLDGGQPTKGRPSKRKGTAEPSATFVELESSRVARAEPIELVVDGRVVIRVPAGFDASTLERTLRVLGVRA